MRMGPLDVSIHLLNFAAPAAGLALLMLVFNLIFKRNLAASYGLYRQAAIDFVVGMAALAVGLWVFGRDGMMATYVALVFLVATGQWVMRRGWRA
jgi:hypothetical protein